MTQLALSRLLQDRAFLLLYRAECRRRLSAAYQRLTHALMHLRIPFVPAQSGIFVFCDLSEFLPQGEEPPFEREQALFETLVQRYGLAFTPGGACHCPLPGYFRICYAYYADSEGALDRLIAQLARMRSEREEAQGGEARDGQDLKEIADRLDNIQLKE
jgi:aspartate/methionine/tyrosine aminotransferase